MIHVTGNVVAPFLCSLLSLFIPWVFLERAQMLHSAGPLILSPLVMITNSLATFALNVSVFLAIQNTSALTIRVASVVKDWLVVFISALLFADTILTPLNIVGYAIGERAKCGVKRVCRCPCAFACPWVLHPYSFNSMPGIVPWQKMPATCKQPRYRCLLEFQTANDSILSCTASHH